MPLVSEDKITRKMLKQNPEWLFLFGDNVERYGLKGQAAAMRGEPNAVGVRTKKLPKRHAGAYFYDSDFNTATAMIAEDLALVREYLEAGGTVVVPSSGLGTGLAALETTSPKIFTFLCEQLYELSQINC